MGAARRPGDHREESLASLPCAICGRPSAGWVYTSETDEQGRDMIAAYSACAAHRLEVVQKADTQAS